MYRPRNYSAFSRSTGRFSLFSFLIVIAITFIIGSLVYNVAMRGTPYSADIPQEARRYLTQLGYTIEGLSCADVDSDNDGYVSCTARLKEMPTPYAFECGTGFFGTGGCRQPKPSTYRW